jgi:hypothetical protein
MNDSYNADSIKILTPEEVLDKFRWVEIESLSHKYHKPKKFIENGFEACRRAGVDKEYFVQYYLEKNPDYVRNPLVEDAYKDLIREQL